MQSYFYPVLSMKISQKLKFYKNLHSHSTPKALLRALRHQNRMTRIWETWPKMAKNSQFWTVFDFLKKLRFERTFMESLFGIRA